MDVIFGALAPYCWTTHYTTCQVLAIGSDSTEQIAVYCNSHHFLPKKYGYGLITLKLKTALTKLLRWGCRVHGSFCVRPVKMLFAYLTWQIKMCPFRKNHNIFWVNALKHVLTQCCIHFAICPTLYLNQHNFVGMHFQISMQNSFTFKSNNVKYTFLPQRWLLNWTFHCRYFSGPVAVCRQPWGFCFNAEIVPQNFEPVNKGFCHRN